MPGHTIIDVHVLLLRDDKVLLTQRRGNYGAGLWHLPSGKLEPGESLPAAGAREAHEEVGVIINPDHLHLIHTAHVADSGPTPRLGLFFTTHHWLGEPYNREPDKCSDIAWFPLTALPDVIPYPLTGIHAYLHGRPLTTTGWNTPALTQPA
ncbi:NUDIX hydrolase [Actinokineospora terrae]|uniref:ADP-ribose pyrophosphatase YjhB, NUDIX family n=1 Tax=Actinokineospora terrae TaxID=155974 RepID=A0A1H9M9K0_9PSEU|nr:NUDIX domain-containing protein [Actinokineospora terrae]SER20358.1 ADP-ribose pyrophosphatase YjhB, NUDIX family [Actinokineospora terrae]